MRTGCCFTASERILHDRHQVNGDACRAKLQGTRRWRISRVTAESATHAWGVGAFHILQGHALQAEARVGHQQCVPEEEQVRD